MSGDVGERSHLKLPGSTKIEALKTVEKFLATHL
jgi:hypothetical protein